jgi:hypothetical protein
MQLAKKLEPPRTRRITGVFVPTSAFGFDVKAAVVYFTDRFPQAEDVTYLELPGGVDPR